MSLIYFYSHSLVLLRQLTYPQEFLAIGSIAASQGIYLWNVNTVVTNSPVLILPSVIP
ncbi:MULTISPECIES: hypothetical protein [unclassified Nostoc]|uniref:hypothetical protein n=1 Tax=unclassified Nostoc TaxID=2593658 RepID=UPI002AD33A70|nr:hypothetical protein [Nostoc sp. DedQUE03]MDZ7974244.1 hypothetical protein [Nostoc sp. DedQUE03]MDZ8042900.1 hypothetical protein [Nostoc sp. DedQUE02]